LEKAKIKALEDYQHQTFMITWMMENMKSERMKITIQSEDELLKVAEEAIKIIANLRKFTKQWEESYGVELKKERNVGKLWQINYR